MPPAAPAKPAEPYTRAWAMAIESSEPALLVAVGTDRLVLAGENRALEARALETGAVLWTAPAAVTQPVVSAGRVFGVAGARLHALSADTGQPLWAVPLEGTTSGPAVIADLLLVTSGPELRAYRPADGSVLWRQPLPAPATRRPIAARDLVVVALAGNLIAAFDRQTGTRAWQTALDSAPSPMTADAERIFFGTASGLICALPIAGGEPDWCFRSAPVPSAGAPVIHDGAVFFALFDNTLRAFAAEGGTLTRLETLPARPALGPLRVGDLLAVPLTTSAVALIPVVGPAPVRLVSAFDQAPGPSLRDAAASPDGSWLASVSTDPAGRVWVAAYRRTPPPPAPAPPNK